MSKRAGRNLNPFRVQLALQTQAKKHELAMKMVADRVAHDAEFAADVLKIGGEFLREDIKKSAQETILKSVKETVVPNKVFQLESDKDEPCIPDLPSDVDPDVTPEQIKQAIITHCKTSKEQFDELPEAVKIATDALDKDPVEIIEDRD